MSIDLWRKRRDFTLPEAALLLSGNNPDNFSEQQIMSKPPEGFKAIYGALRSDAATVIDPYVQSEEDSEAYYTLYALMTDKPGNLRKITEHDGFSIHVEAQELIAWAKRKEFGLGLLDPTHTRPTIDNGLHPREKKSLYRIIGALKEIVLENVPDFETQESLIAHLVSQYNGYEGLSASKLENVFSEANRLLKQP